MGGCGWDCVGEEGSVGVGSPSLLPQSMTVSGGRG